MVTKTQLTTGIILTLLLAVGGTYFVAQDDDVFYCESRDLVMICEKLSKINAEGIQTRCYFEETYKACKEGWVEFEIIEKFNIPEAQEGTKWICSPEGCVVLE